MPTPKRPPSRQPPWQGDETGPSDFGPWLQRQRELRGVALRDIADDTKISMRYLQALEANRFDILPAQVFVRGFLRQYSRFVGLDPDEVVNAFLTAAQEGSPEDGGTGTPEEEGSSARGAGGRGWILVLIAASVAAVMVLAALAAFSWRQSRERPTAPTAARQETPVGVPPAQTSSAKPHQSAESPPEEALPTAARSPVVADIPASPPPSTAGREPASGQAPAGQGVEQGGASPGSRAEQAASSKPIVVILDFNADCWVDAIADGSRHVSELAVQGESLRVEADREVSLTLGDGDAASILVNGSPYPLPKSRRKVRHLVIDLSTLSALTARSQPAHD